MDINSIKSVYFIGAGGIGMSALARYFLSKGKNVGGYDRTSTELTGKLSEEGALIHYEEDIDLIPQVFKDKESTLVIYTPAIPKNHKELVFFQENGFEIQKRAQVLGMLTKTEKGLCVAGTHGKTTTSTMAAHLLQQSHIGCNAFLGGVSKNYNTNLLLSETSKYVVIEADEFDRSFHHLRPYASVITSADPDHLDIYGTKEAYLESFAKYTSLVCPGGYLIIKKGIAIDIQVQEGVKVYSYGIDEGDFRARNIRIANGEITFDYISPLGDIDGIQLGVPVMVNIENGVAAMALAQIAGATAEEIRKAMPTFGGVGRRFDFKIKDPGHVLLSDYAHHPAEIRQSISSIKTLYPDKKVTVAFQPHLFTRTRDFYTEFAESLSLADEVLLLDIYPAREQPIDGVSAKLVFDCIKPGIRKKMCTKDGLLDTIKVEDPEVLAILGAGDIDDLVPQIYNIIKQK